MKDEWNLSDCMGAICQCGTHMYKDVDVKEFIRRLKEAIKNNESIHIDMGYGDGCGYHPYLIEEEIDKLAGDALR